MQDTSAIYPTDCAPVPASISMSKQSIAPKKQVDEEHKSTRIHEYTRTHTKMHTKLHTRRQAHKNTRTRKRTHLKSASSHLISSRFAFRVRLVSSRFALFLILDSASTGYGTALHDYGTSTARVHCIIPEMERRVLRWTGL